MSYGLLFLRLVVGGVIAAHGAQKLFGAFGGHGLRGTGEGFRALRFRAPTEMALLAGVAEVAGGLLLAAGLLTPFAALAIAVVMLVAIASVHWRNGFWANDAGYEYNLTIWATAVALAATGPGRFSFDRLFGWDDNLSGLWWGIGVLVASALIAGVTLVLGRETETVLQPSGLAGGNGNDRAVSPVEVQVANASDGNDLVGYLRQHGLPASLIESPGNWNVEVGSRRAVQPDLMHELVDALQSWLPGQGPAGVVIQFRERRTYTTDPRHSA